MTQFWSFSILTEYFVSISLLLWCLLLKWCHFVCHLPLTTQLCCILLVSLTRGVSYFNVTNSQRQEHDTSRSTRPILQSQRNNNVKNLQSSANKWESTADEEVVSAGDTPTRFTLFSSCQNLGARVKVTWFSSKVKCSCDTTERHKKTYVVGCICKISLWCDFQITKSYKLN
jgi:hypothetical protein